MTDISGSGIATCVGLIVIGVAYGFHAGVRRRVGDLARTPLKLTALLSLLVPAAAVLLLSFPVLTVCRLYGSCNGWLHTHSLYIRAWFVFWSLVLAIDGLEFVLRFFFALRERPFPVPPLIRNILHLEDDPPF